MLKFKYFAGKDLTLEVYGEFFFYYTLVISPISLPIAILMSSLMTFGNLGEHSEIKAIKSIGISFVRLVRYPFIITLLITFCSLYFIDQIVPYASLKAYSLLYDVKKKKPTFKLEEKVFYYDIPNYSIKIEEKIPLSSEVHDIMIYDHTRRRGNTQVITSDTAHIYSTRNERFLVLDLTEGYIYADVSKEKPHKVEKPFASSHFKSAKLFFDMSSFDLSNTQERLFLGHNVMKDRKQLVSEADSSVALLDRAEQKRKKYIQEQVYVESRKDSTHNTDSTLRKEDQVFGLTRVREVREAIQDMRATKLELSNMINSESRLKAKIRYYNIDIQRKYAEGVIVFIMFLIGAPLGAILKRGGFGMPIIICIMGFVLYYILMMAGVRMARAAFINPYLGCWLAHIICLSIGTIALRKAIKDSDIFDIDRYKLFRMPENSQDS